MNVTDIINPPSTIDRQRIVLKGLRFTNEAECDFLLRYDEGSQGDEIELVVYPDDHVIDLDDCFPHEDFVKLATDSTVSISTLILEPFSDLRSALSRFVLQPHIKLEFERYANEDTIAVTLYIGDNFRTIGTCRVSDVWEAFEVVRRDDERDSDEL